MGRRRSQKENESKKIWKVALYIRLSREDGKEESYSITNQKQILMKHLETFDEEYELIDVYSDDGYSGTDSDRHDFQRLLEDIKIKKVNCVIVKDLSRLSRNYSEAGYYLEHYFVNHNVRFISLELPSLDSYKYPEQMNSIIVPIQNVINDDFCRQTSIKIRGVFNVKRSNGEFVGAFTPYGYLKDPNNKHKFIIDEEAAQVVRDIFSWFINDGMSKVGIARKLNSLGISNPTKYKNEMGLKYYNPNKKFNESFWNTYTIGSMLVNLMYIGYMVQGRQKMKSYKIHEQVRVPKEEWFIVENTHEPIIDQETFDKAQQLLLRDTRTAPNKNEVHLFAGFLKCFDCGRALHRRRSEKNSYFYCRQFQVTGECKKHSIREDRLTNAVLVNIQKRIDLVIELANTLDEINKLSNVNIQSTRLKTMLKKRQEELQEVESISDSLYVDWKSGDITQDEYRRLKVNFLEKSKQIKSSIREINEQLNETSNGISTNNLYYERFIKYNNITTLTREMIVELIDVILIDENSNVIIKFNFTDQYQDILQLIENNKKPLEVTV